MTSLPVEGEKNWAPKLNDYLLEAAVGAAAGGSAAAEAARDAALVAAADAEDAAAAAAAIGNTNDSLIAGRINDPASLTRAAVDAGLNPFGVDVRRNGVAGDGVADDTAAIAAVRNAAAALGAPLYFPSGTYVTTGLNHNKPGQDWNLHPNAVIKFKDGAANSSGSKRVVTIAAQNARLIGGKIDGNRAGQDKAAFNTAGGSSAAGGRAVFGIDVSGSSSTPLSGVVIDTTIVNCIDAAITGSYLTRSDIRAVVIGGGRGPRFDHVTDTRFDFALRSIDNDGWKVFPHALDLFYSDRITLAFDCTDHFGNGSISGGTALDDYLSGVTIADVRDLTVNGLRVEARDSNLMAKGLGISLLSVREMRANNVAVIGYSDVAIEVAGVVDSSIDGLTIDGRYQTVAGGAGAAGRGLAMYDIGFAKGAFASRVSRFTEDVTISNFVIKRCLGNAIDLWTARNTKWVSGKVVGNLRGVQAKYELTNAGEFVARTPRELSGHKFIGVDFSYNELHGFEATDLSSSTFVACTFNNNGQASALGTTRRGLAVEANASGFSTLATVTAGLSKTGLELHACYASDTQSFTGHLGPNPSSPATLSVDDDSHYVVGQTITLVGAGPAGADLTTWIREVQFDEITVQTAPSTDVTIAGTGTIATAGTAVTGTGTAFSTQFDARYYITAGGVTRRIAKIQSNTAATLESAFPSDVAAGTSFTIHRTTVTGVPSQKYGYRYSSDTISPRMYGGGGTGNITAIFSDGTVLTTRLRTVGIIGQVSRLDKSLASGGNVTASADSGAETVIGTVGPASQPAVKLHDTALYRDNTNRLRTPGKLTADLGIGVGNSAAATTPGSVVRKVEVFDAAGASLGFIPIYSTIT